MKQLAPNLMVDNVRETTNFYVSVLGFTLLDKVDPQERWVWALVKNEGVRFMFQDKASLQEEYPLFEGQEKSQASLTFYINVEDVQALWTQVQGKARVVKGLHKTFYGSTDFTIEDNNGYVLVFSQAAPAE